MPCHPYYHLITTHFTYHIQWHGSDELEEEPLLPDLPEPLPLLPLLPEDDEPHESEDDDDQPLHPSNLLPPLLPDLPEDEDDHEPDEHGLPRSRVWIEMYEKRKV